MASRWYSRSERMKALAREFLERGFYPESCFFAQQAVEFYLKGKLLELTGSRPYTHSILHLVQSLLRIRGGEAPGELIRCAKYLTEQYLGSRYPDARMLEHDREDAEECVRCMESILAHV